MFFTAGRPYTLKSRTFIFLSVLISYFIVCFCGLELASINKFASPIWLASGLAIGALTVFGIWLAPAIYIGAFAVNYIIGMLPLTALIAAAGNMLEAAVASYLILFIMRKNYFKSYSEFFSIFAGSFLPTMISATIGTGALYFDGTVEASLYSYTWYTWWSGDMIGSLIVLPIFFEIFSPKEDQSFSPKKLLPRLAFAAYFFGMTYLVFVVDFSQAHAWALTPVLIVCGIMQGRLYSRTMLFLLSIFIIFLTSFGYGPFDYGDRNLDFICIQSLLVSYSFAILFVRPLNTKYKISYKYLLGIASGWLTLFVIIHLITVYEKKYILEDYNKTTAAALDTLIQASSQYELLLDGSTALFRVKKDITREDWNSYSKSLHLDSIFSAISGLGFTSLIKKTDLPAFEKKTGLKVRILDAEYSKHFNDHFIVTYLEPTENNQVALGLDGGSEKNRREAAEMAKKTHSSVATKPITLVQDSEQRKAFLIYHPIWNINDEFVGWSYAPVISSVFFGKVFEKISHLLKVKVSVEGDPIHRTDQLNEEEFGKSHYYTSKDVVLFGLKHKIEFYPTNLFFTRHSGYSVYLALLLNLFMLLIAAFLLEQLTFSQRAEAMVEARTKELENSRLQLINASKMASLGEMASGLAHEINNPLAIIQGKVKVITLMLEDLNIQNPIVVEEIEKIKVTTDRIEKIIKGLRNFSRPSQFDPFEPASLPKIIQETLDLCSEKFKAEGISIIVHDIPKIYISCRPSQISQVLINLFNNSRDAIREKDIKWIELDFKVTENTLSIIFTDSGSGIPAEVAEKIMEPFFTTKESHMGTGLGLSIAKSLVETHGGSLRLDATYKNTRFILELNIKEAEDFLES